jgi:hypothetical protein
MQLSGKKYCIITHLAVIFKWTRGDTVLQMGISDSVQNLTFKKTCTMKKNGGTQNCTTESEPMYNTPSEILDSISQS